jgi:predicted Holliday junction resolvase-like endonuclease
MMLVAMMHPDAGLAGIVVAFLGMLGLFIIFRSEALREEKSVSEVKKRIRKSRRKHRRQMKEEERERQKREEEELRAKIEEEKKRIEEIFRKASGTKEDGLKNSEAEYPNL